MEISNKKRIVKIKRAYSISMLSLIAFVGLFLWLGLDVWAWIAGGLFVACLSLMQFFQVNYIYYNSDEEKLLIRYYAASSLFGAKYSSIEFEKNLLYSIAIKRSNSSSKINIFADLAMLIKTPRGIMEYPDVSLVGLTAVEIDLIEDDLKEIIASNKETWRKN